MTFGELVTRVPKTEDNLVSPKIYEKDLLYQLGLDGIAISCPEVKAYWMYKFYKNGYPIGSMIVFCEDVVIGILHIEVDRDSDMTWRSQNAQNMLLQAYLNCRSIPTHTFISGTTEMKGHYNVRESYQLRNVDLSKLKVRDVTPYKIEFLPDNAIGSEHGMMVQMTPESKPMRVSLSIIDIPLPLLTEEPENAE